MVSGVSNIGMDFVDLIEPKIEREYRPLIIMMGSEALELYQTQDIADNYNWGSKNYIRLPARYDPLPSIPTYLPKGVVPLTREELTMYLRRIQEGGIGTANGIGLSSHYYYWCDYCNERIHEDYNYCHSCLKDMCEDCHTEVTHGIIKAERAETYDTRAEDLILCLSGHPLKKRPLCVSVQYCSQCDQLLQGSYYESMMTWMGKYMCLTCAETEEGASLMREEEYTLVNKDRSQSACECDLCGHLADQYYGEEDYHVCESCSKTEQGKGLISDLQLAMVNSTMPCYSSGMGSLMDWIPILRTDDHIADADYLLINLNPASPYYHHYGVNVDRSGDRAYYTIGEPDLGLDELLEEIRQRLPNDDERSLIKRFMKARNPHIRDFDLLINRGQLDDEDI